MFTLAGVACTGPVPVAARRRTETTPRPVVEKEGFEEQKKADKGEQVGGQGLGGGGRDLHRAQSIEHLGVERTLPNIRRGVDVPVEQRERGVEKVFEACRIRMRAKE